MKVLVTGSAGFLGQSLVLELCERGHEVFGIDRREDPRTPNFLRQDLSRAFLWPGPSLDVVIHLASSVGGFLHNSNARGLERGELKLLENVTRLCDATGCKRIVYASSINVFENAPHFSHGPNEFFNQRTPYARAKAQGEKFVEQNFGEFVIIRPTNLFGREQSRERKRIGGSHVIPELLHKIRSQNALEVLGDGTQQRNFLHVSDASRFFALVLGEPRRAWINLRSEIQLSILQLAEQLLSWSGTSRPLVFRPEYLVYEPRAIEEFDLAVPKSLGWEPRIRQLAEGL